MCTRLLKSIALTVFIVMISQSISVSATLQSQTSVGYYIPHSGESIFDRLQALDIVEMTLTAELDSLIEVRNSNDYKKALLSYKDENGVNQNYDIKVRPRGKFRRRICDMPPLKLKVSKKQLEAAGLNEHNDMKLVTHCLDDENYSETLVLREYLAYKLFNELTPYSYRVQLVNITYQDTHDKNYQIEQYGFLIEDLDELAERLEGEECEGCFGLEKEKYDKSAERIASVFQFMIGNSDWSTTMNRNVKQFTREDGSIIPVPYDFDFSVLVSAPYMRPNTDLNQTTKMERIFMGHSTEVSDIYGTLSYFKTKRKALINLVRNFDRLSREDRLAIELYLESFFKQLYSKESIQSMFFDWEAAPVR